jgi:hypothetical protein
MELPEARRQAGVISAGQAGVVSRRQVLAAGLDDDFIERRLRRREWARVHRGVYVDHTGPLSWHQRLWAALLYAAPAAAADESALVLHGLRQPMPREPIHVAIPDHRRVLAPDGVRVHHVREWEPMVHPHRVPARMRLEPAVLRVAAKASDDVTAVAVLADAGRSRRTTPERLLAALDLCPRLRGRRLLRDVLQDAADGVCSVLEHRYLVRVERAHRLPAARRQRRVELGRRPAYRDVEHLDGRVVVELDGRLGLEATDDRWADLERDVDSYVDGAVTLRLTWGMVLSPCRAAATVARVLRHAGWGGEPRRCGAGCTAVRP